jgi:hypothetical protein
MSRDPYKSIIFTTIPILPFHMTYLANASLIRYTLYFRNQHLPNSATWGPISVRKIRRCVREAKLILTSLNE